MFVACQNMLKALISWRAARPGISLKLETPVLKVLKSTRAGYKCNLNAAGCVSWPQGLWDTCAPVAFCDKFAHNLRVQWRKTMLLSCLSSDRNDASIARAANLRVSTQLVEKLHTSASSCEGHQFAILCGGLETHALLRLQVGFSANKHRKFNSFFIWDTFTTQTVEHLEQAFQTSVKDLEKTMFIQDIYISDKPNYFLMRQNLFTIPTFV